MDKNKSFYVVYQDGESEQFWNQYESMEDAVSGEGGKEVEVYEVTPKYLGCYDSAVKTVLTKKKKKEK